jgi:hypothetical protein
MSRQAESQAHQTALSGKRAHVLPDLVARRFARDPATAGLTAGRSEAPAKLAASWGDLSQFAVGHIAEVAIVGVPAILLAQLGLPKPPRRSNVMRQVVYKRYESLRPHPGSPLEIGHDAREYLRRT